jgi:hypothetical protein
VSVLVTGVPTGGWPEPVATLVKLCVTPMTEQV